MTPTLLGVSHVAHIADNMASLDYIFRPSRCVGCCKRARATHALQPIYTGGASVCGLGEPRDSLKDDICAKRFGTE